MNPDDIIHDFTLSWDYLGNGESWPIIIIEDWSYAYNYYSYVVLPQEN